MPKKQLFIAYDTQQEAQAAMDLLGRNTSDWYERIETATIPSYSEDMPVLEDFEDATSDWNHDADTSLTGNGSLATPYLFYRIDGGTPSSATGPTTGASGSSYYVYTEASSPASPNKYFYMERSLVAGSGVSKMTFYYHMFGASMDYQNASYANEKAYLSVEVSTDNGVTWTPLSITKDVDGAGEQLVSRIEGQQQVAQSSPYKKAEVDISSVGNNSFKIRFFAKTADRDPTNNTSQSWKSDIAIDNISFYRPPSQARYLVETDGKGYEVLFAHKVSQEGNYATTKQTFIANEYSVTDEEKAINGWTSTYYQNEEKMSLRRATEEYIDSGYDISKRQQYLDWGGTLLQGQ